LAPPHAHTAKSLLIGIALIEDYRICGKVEWRLFLHGQNTLIWADEQVSKRHWNNALNCVSASIKRLSIWMISNIRTWRLFSKNVIVITRGTRDHISNSNSDCSSTILYSNTTIRDCCIQIKTYDITLTIPIYSRTKKMDDLELLTGCLKFNN